MLAGRGRGDGIVLRGTATNAPMHLVVLAWLYVVFAMSLTMDSLAAGVAMFAVLGVAPVGLWVLLRVRRLRAQRERAAAAPPER